ncbi:hypothetical protein [Glycocaulis alkaliphilus]|uniref:hypothetical protein n=1 Tax=Glycocaulis alkaliphilus TaxID=1434191 RepID=UPI000FD87BED|nr:hypothetical protein [Glycocaulis alkaliphilus]
MAKYGTIEFAGASGASYMFTAYSRDTNFNAVGAVYFVTKRSPNGPGRFSHAEIYVGETGDLSDRPLNHHRKDCFDRNGANCVCVLTESDRNRRLYIEADIRQKHEPPCNRQ